MKNVSLTVLGVIGALVLLAVLGAGIWQLGWFIEEKNVDRRTGINNRSTARQLALQEEILDKYRDVTDIDVQLTEASDAREPALVAQRQAILDQMCDAWDQTTGSAILPDRIESYLLGECL